MQQRSLVLLCFLLAATFCVQHIRATCNVCNPSNNVACISKTEYYFCSNNVPITGTGAISCPDGTVCTDRAARCMPDGAPIDCASKCGICDGSQLFTCKTRNTFVQCNGTAPMTNVGQCPENYVCSVKAKEPICVSSCNEDSNTLDCP